MPPNGKAALLIAGALTVENFQGRPEVVDRELTRPKQGRQDPGTSERSLSKIFYISNGLACRLGPGLLLNLNRGRMDLLRTDPWCLLGQSCTCGSSVLRGPRGRDLGLEAGQAPTDRLAHLKFLLRTAKEAAPRRRPAGYEAVGECWKSACGCFGEVLWKRAHGPRRGGHHIRKSRGEREH